MKMYRLLHKFTPGINVLQDLVPDYYHSWTKFFFCMYWNFIPWSSLLSHNIYNAEADILLESNFMLATHLRKLTTRTYVVNTQAYPHMPTFSPNY